MKVVAKIAVIGFLAGAAVSGGAEAGKVQVRDAKGNLVTMEESKSFPECVRRSMKLGYTKAGSERYCGKYFTR